MRASNTSAARLPIPKPSPLNLTGLKSGAAIWLDLGKVGDLAEVWLNGKRIDLAWYAPYRVDISKALKPGNNQLQIKVTNEWTNRLIGDKANPIKKCWPTM